MKEMKEIKLGHARKKSNIDKNFLKSSEGLKEFKDQGKKVTIEDGKSTNNRQVSTPGLIKFTKPDEEDFEDEITRKKTTANDINEIINKYDKPNLISMPSFNLTKQKIFEREKAREEILEVHGESINSKNKYTVPVLNIKSAVNSSDRNQHENIFLDPVTERECSFINNISINHSNFIYDGENKDNDVVLCISNLDIDLGKKHEEGGMHILQSEEKFITSAKSKHDTQDNINDISIIDSQNCDKKKLIKNSSQRGKKSKYIIVILVVVILLTISFLTAVIFHTINKS
jgi:hypothetical protein